MGSIVLGVLSTAVLASSSWGQPGPAPAVCAGSIHGHVVDAATHEPIAGATVIVNGTALALADDTGTFALAGLCPGELMIEAERADYERGGRTVALVTTASLELELRPLAGEVIVIQDETPRSVDMQATAVVSGDALEHTRGRTFSETLAEVPGVSQLRSASGVAKPIVRGQYGRRLLLLVDSVRHRAQEWGLDHAPEIDPFETCA